MSQPSQAPKLCISVKATTALAMIFALTVVLAPAAHSQTFQILQRFVGVNGEYPNAGLTIDAQGRLYGTTTQGGPGGPDEYGTVFRLTHVGSGWVMDVLYTFQNGSDGAFPEGRVIFGPDGTLYGTAAGGGSECDPPSGCGVVFNLQPPPTACKTPLCPWRETVIHSFQGTQGGYDGEGPTGDLVFDSSGNIYGTTSLGGQYDHGVAYELSKVNGVWTENRLYSFTNFFDGPYSGLTPDANGNLYGTIPDAYGYDGAVYELTPSGNTWTQQVIHYFQGTDGGAPFAGVIFDNAGNLYGATTSYGASNGGTAFELSPANGGWSFSVLYNFFRPSNGYAPGPRANLAFDSSGSLYGTTYADGANQLGSVFKLTPGAGGWTYTSLYDFNDPYTAQYPISNVVFDSSGNLYGTTSSGGPPNDCPCGVIWEITP